MKLPATERRRSYYQQMVAETSLLFGIDKAEASIFVERFVLTLRSKLAIGDDIHFGSGKIFQRISKPRAFSVINGLGPNTRENTQFGERTHWKVKFNSRWVNPT